MQREREVKKLVHISFSPISMKTVYYPSPTSSSELFVKKNAKERDTYTIRVRYSCHADWRDPVTTSFRVFFFKKNKRYTLHIIGTKSVLINQ